MSVTLPLIFLLILLGCLFGAISILAGTGGGVFFVSFMTIFLLLPINESIDTSNFIILLTSTSGFLVYLKDKRTNIKMSLIYGGFSILGSVSSTILTLLIDINNLILRIAFSTLLIIIGLYMMIRCLFSYLNLEKKEEKTKEGLNAISSNNFEYYMNLKISIPLFFLAGFASNLLGIGGGVINTPVLNLVMKVPIHYATAISTSIVFFTAIYNSIVKFIFGQINVIVGIFLGLGAIFGGILGAKVSNKMPKIQLELVLSFILIIFAFMMYI
jgi:uncharacterized membrane protein YfcA